jgi:hypothetical protein
MVRLYCQREEFSRKIHGEFRFSRNLFNTRFFKIVKVAHNFLLFFHHSSRKFSQNFPQIFTEISQPQFINLGVPRKTGWMIKEGHFVKSWKRRWFVLSRNLLIYYKAPEVIFPRNFRLRKIRQCNRTTTMI